MTKEKFRKTLLNSDSSFRFLAAEEGHWLGVDDYGNERDYSIEDMPKKYKKNCIAYLKKQRGNIETGEFLAGVKFNKADYKELVEYGCKAMEEKISQLSK